jgi:hypothetical protein
MQSDYSMRSLCFAAVLVALAACSPTTDITRTSTERTAGRTGYDAAGSQVNGDLLRVELKVDSLGAAQTVAEDVVIKKRGPFERVEVEVFGPDDQVKRTPSGVLRWSAAGGFSYKKNR